MNRLTVIAFFFGVLSSFLGGTLGIIAASPITEDRTEQVFVYGTLTNPLYRTYACLCLTELEPTRLTGYAKTIRNIIPAKNSFVPGGIIRVSRDELARIDAYEGVPTDYRRFQVVVDGRYVWVYQKTE